jgi:uncharacterized protein YxjI
MRENLVSFGDDFWIETTRGRRAFFVDGKALRVRDTLNFKDAQGNDLAKIQQKMLRIRDTMTIDREGVGTITVKKALINPLRERFTAEMPSGGDIDIQGNITAHNYTMERGGQRVAEVSKKWVAIRDTYTVEVAPGEDDVSILAITVAVDQMTHDVG